MSEVYYLQEDDYLNKRVEIILANRKQKYRKLLHMIGTVTRATNKEVGVMVDGINNSASQYGVFWFQKHELRIVEDNMKDFNKVAIVNLFDDYKQKDYGFALYDEDMELLEKGGYEEGYYKNLVVVNANGKNNRIVGKVKSIMDVENYNKGISAQVVGVVNMDTYNARINEEDKRREIAKKKAEIEKILDEEINKRKSIEYYQEMAQKYHDNPKLLELVTELKRLDL